MHKNIAPINLRRSSKTTSIAAIAVPEQSADLCEQGCSDLLASVPALPATLVRLWLSISEPTIDLHSVCRAVRADLGLTLRVMQLSRSLGGTSSARIHESVVHLGVADLRRLSLLMPVLSSGQLGSCPPSNTGITLAPFPLCGRDG